jgi:hypothetical protein
MSVVCSITAHRKLMDADGLMSINLWMKKLTMAMEVSTYPLNSFGTL